MFQDRKTIEKRDNFINGIRRNLRHVLLPKIDDELRNSLSRSSKGRYKIQITEVKQKSNFIPKEISSILSPNGNGRKSPALSIPNSEEFNDTNSSNMNISNLSIENSQDNNNSESSFTKFESMSKMNLKSEKHISLKF